MRKLFAAICWQDGRKSVEFFQSFGEFIAGVLERQGLRHRFSPFWTVSVPYFSDMGLEINNHR